MGQRKSRRRGANRKSIEDWERTFREQSERRRRRAKRRTLIRRSALLAGITGSVVAALWALNL